MPKGTRLFWMACVALVLSCTARVFAAPVNDNFAQASVMEARPGFVSGSTVGATAESGEALWGTASVWFKWIPDISSGWELSYVSGLNGDGLLVFEGESFQAFKQVGYAMGERTGSFWVEAGKTYYIRVEAGRPGGDSFMLRFDRGPVNDGFAGRIRLGGEGTYEGSMYGASIEPGEPDYMAMQGRSLWWEWTAAATGSYYFSVPYSYEAGPWLTVFQGSSITALTRIESQAVYAADAMHNTVFRATAGETYVLRIVARIPDQYVVRFGLHQGPLNDEWENAAPLAKLDNETEGNTTGSTYQPREVKRYQHGGGTVWYWWEAPRTGNYVARTLSEGGLGEIHVYRGTSLATLQSVQQAERSYNSGGEYVFPFSAPAGEKLFVSVDPAGLPTGPFTLSIITPAANDSFAAAERLEGAAVESPWRDFLATIEPNEPQYAGIKSMGSLWWRWTAPSSGSYVVHSEHDVKPVALGIHSGASLATLTRVTAQTNRADKVYVGFYAEAGREYYIHLAQDAGTSEPVRVIIEPGVRNDDMARANSLSGASDTDSLYFRVATQEPDEPLVFPDKGTFWWKWSAPASGSYIFSGWSSLWQNGEAEVAVFAGATRAELRLVGRGILEGQNTAAITFRATQGEVFHFVVAERPAPGPEQVYISATIDPGPRNDDFANATVLSGEVNFALASTYGATREIGEPNHGKGTNSGSIWFRWVAPFSGNMLVAVDNPDVSGKAYRGSALENLTPISTGTISTRTLPLNVSAGVEYFFALEASPTVPLDFHFSLGKAPANDLYANRARIDQFGVRYRSWTAFAGIESGEIWNGPSVWWTWTAPADGVVTMLTEALGTTARAEIFYQEPLLGSPATNGLSFQSQLVSPTNRAAVVAGRTYDIRLVTAIPSTSVGLILNFIPAPETNRWSDESFLRGGTALWTEQTNVVRSPPTTMQPGPSVYGEKSWIQRRIVGFGRLTFWWRRSSDELKFEVLGLPGRNGYVLTQQPSSQWSQVQVTLAGTNLVRWTAQRLSFPTPTAPAVYLDDVVFTPNTLTFLDTKLNSDGNLVLPVLADYGKGHYVLIFETSNDLRTWTYWKSFSADVVTTNAFEFRLTNQVDVAAPQGFFRVRPR